MRKKTLALAAAAALLLTGCESARIADVPDTAVDIALPYATVAPTEGPADSGAPLVITEDGDVYLSDPALLDGTGPADGLRVGDEGEEVYRLERRLYQLNYQQSAPDGVFGEDTAEAVALFSRTLSRGELRTATKELTEALFSEGAPLYGTKEYESAAQNAYVALQTGDRGPAVASLRRRLNELGYPVSAEGDLYDSETADAVGMFFLACGMEACPVATVTIQKKLYGGSAAPYVKTADAEIDDPDKLEIGSAGTQVEMLQRQLACLGYPQVEVTGKYGVQEYLAVGRIQNALGVSVTGAASQGLCRILLCCAAPSYAQVCGLEDMPSKQLQTVGRTDYGIAVQRQQMRLKDLGYLSGTPNGRYDERMQEAIDAFRRKCGLSGSGELDLYETALLTSPCAPGLNGETLFERAASVTEDAAEEIPALRPGDRSAAVLAVNGKLSALGWIGRTYTDEYTKDTEKAVRRLQACLECEATGEVSGGMYRFLSSAAVPAVKAPDPEAEEKYRDIAAGENGYRVTKLQRALVADGLLGYGSANGTYGDSTREAVREVQLGMGYCRPDGLADACFQSVYLGREG